jgi:hypothetical protein
VSTESLKRKLALKRRRSARKQRQGAASASPYIAAVLEADRRRRQEKAAATAMVAFAQTLASTVMQPPDAPGARESRGVASASARASVGVSNAAPESRAPSKSAPNAELEEIDPHRIYTWDELMRRPWVGELNPDRFNVGTSIFNVPEDDSEEE